MNSVKGYLFLRNLDGKMKSFNLNSCKEVKYDGQIENGIPNGIGNISYQDGTNYVGELKDGKYNGLGTYTLPNGQKYDGEFRDGDKCNGRVHDNSGINKSQYVNGVKQ